MFDLDDVDAAERWDPYRFIHVERPCGAHAWIGPFDNPRACLSWVRLWATSLVGTFVPLDVTWSISERTTP
jgi:hypothetical protein